MIPRRHFLALGIAGAAAARAAGRQIRREVFLRSPGKGTALMACAYYTRPSGGQMISIEQRWSRSDTIDIAYYRHSIDNGRSWSAPIEMTTGEKRPGGMWRKHPRGIWLDSAGRFVEFWLEGTLPNDDPLEGLRQWRIFYRAPEEHPQQVIHKGAGFNEVHWLPGVWAGKNCAMLGDNTCRPIATKGGEILLPLAISPLGPRCTIPAAATPTTMPRCCTADGTATSSTGK